MPQTPRKEIPIDMIRIQEAIVVEGRYDKNTLSQVVDALILETQGFSIFSNKEQLALLRRIAMERGLIVLTDSDGAGFLIRNHLKSSLPPQCLKQAYVPDIYGKEKRKRKGGKEGKLGVEGMRPEVILDALRRAGATVLGEDNPPSEKTPIAKADLFVLGLTGRDGSALLRQKLMQRLALPEHLSTKSLLSVLNALYSLEELREILSKLD